ncbi:hypothetical protein A3852_09660 [Rhodococcus qingshengii]|nr:hypothetical protein A3852_09660 [Rhodococcus qingshengii]
MELVVARVAQDDLEIAEVFEHRGTDAAVPLVKIQSPVDVPADCGLVRCETFGGKKRIQALD